MTAPRHVDMPIAGWGNLPRQRCAVYRPARRRDVARTLHEGPHATYLPRGLGRSYGDAALNEHQGVILDTQLDRLLAFDPDAGLLTCEAGVSFDRILETFLPRGWFLSVTPGTKFVTVGGAIACDVHGKNHHRDGSFANTLDAFTLLTAVGDTLTCSRDENSDVFFATLGGMGLTGIILTARLRLRPVVSAYVKVQYQQATDLNALLAALGDDNQHHYSVAWVDGLARGGTLGRGVLMRGEHASLDDLPAPQRDAPLQPPAPRRRSVPCHLPGFVLNRYSVAAFNHRYYRKHATREAIVDCNAFFYPLDAIHHWNRIYGKRGFYQYQFVLPGDDGGEGVRHVLERLADARLASFLAVLKRFGPESGGLLSFPMPGYTLAIDLPNRGPHVATLLRELDRDVADRGGRVYLAKDACLQRADFEKMYPRLDAFQQIRHRLDPHGRLASSQARRLGLVETLP
ncbi:MAG: FAD-binding oxidoreductase [Phycisphaeraceae bacterium]